MIVCMVNCFVFPHGAQELPPWAMHGKLSLTHSRTTFEGCFVGRMRRWC
uniref:Uncharacterized protein n=1 Tax=Anguilla anguilla TaxID=7936 RepID=A0A0E9TNI4_ANGAN